MIAFFINVVKIIFLLGLLVFIHEGGHFLIAKLFPYAKPPFISDSMNLILSSYLKESFSFSKLPSAE